MERCLRSLLNKHDNDRLKLSDYAETRGAPSPDWSSSGSGEEGDWMYLVSTLKRRDKAPSVVGGEHGG